MNEVQVLAGGKLNLQVGTNVTLRNGDVEKVVERDDMENGSIVYALSNHLLYNEFGRINFEKRSPEDILLIGLPGNGGQDDDDSFFDGWGDASYA